MNDFLTHEQKQNLLKNLTAVLDKDVLTTEDSSNILRICLEACERAENNSSEGNSLSDEENNDSDFNSIKALVANFYYWLDEKQSKELESKGLNDDQVQAES